MSLKNSKKEQSAAKKYMDARTLEHVMDQVCSCGNNHAHKCDMCSVCAGVDAVSVDVSLDTLFELSEFFKFFGDTTRIRIIQILLAGEISVNDIAERLNLEQSVVSHQLRILRTANLVKPRRDGRKMFYGLDDEHIGMIFRIGLFHILHKHED